MIAILIICSLLFGASVAVLYYVRESLRELKHTIQSIKDYEILIHGDDMFLIPPEKIKQLYHKYVKLN